MIHIKDKQIGLGTFPFSNVFSPVSQELAENIVKKFIDLGGHYIETAPTYPKNRIDLPRIIKKFRREDLFIGTKCVLGINHHGLKVISGNREDIREQCFKELERLGIDYIDLLEAHLTPTDVAPYEVTETLYQLKREGVVRCIGASNVTIKDIHLYNKWRKLDFIQNRYSIIHRSEIDSIMDYAIKKDIRFNPFQVIERGQLVNTAYDSGKWRRGDIRAEKKEYSGDVYKKFHLWTLNKLGEIANQAGMSLEEICIRWVFSNPLVTIPVIGATKVWQVEKNMRVGTKGLPSDVLEAIEYEYHSLENELFDEQGMSIEQYRGIIKKL